MAARRAKSKTPAETPRTAPKRRVEKPRPVHRDKPAKAKKPSALDAAAKILAETGQAMNTKEMIQAMQAKGYWTSPAGKTPHATLYSAMLREINLKGKQARFRKTQRGKFALQEPQA